MKNTFYQLISYGKPYKKIAVFGLISALLAATLALLQPLTLKVLIDDVFSGKHREWLTPVVLIFLFGYMMSIFFNSLTNYLFLNYSHLIMLDLRTLIIKKIHRMSLVTLEKNSDGKLISMSINDVSSISNFYQSIIPSTASHIFRILTSLPVLFYFNWKMSMGLIIIVPLFWWAGNIFNKKIRATSIKLQTTIGNASQKVNESIKGTIDIRKYNQINWDIKESRRLFREVKETANENYYPSTFSNQLRNFLYSIPLVILYYLGGRSIFAGTMSIGEAVVFVNLFTSVMAPINMLLNVNSSAQATIGVAKNLFEFLNKNDSDVFNNLQSTKKNSEAIEIKDVSYTYGNGNQGLSLTDILIPINETTIVVGDNGVGKSTLAQIIAGLRKPTTGFINYGKYTLDAIGFVPHEPFIFSGTIKDNILFGREVNQKRIEEICSYVGLDSTINSLPDKYQTYIGEGSNLSSGQLQRLSLARALISPPPVLILDEALSNIDNRSTNELFNFIEQNVDTLIYITHNKEQSKWGDNLIKISKDI